MEEVNLHPIYRLLKVDYADLLELAEQKGQTILLPDLRKLDNFKLTRSFIKSHLIQENGEAQQNDVWVHIEKDTVTLVDCPNYYPSYRQGLYKANIQRTVIRTNSRFIQFKILLIDRPILPFSMGNITGRNNILNRRRYGGGGGGGMDRRKRLQRQTSVDYGLLHPILIDLESELEDENSILTSTTCLSSTVDQTVGSDWMEQGSGRAVGSESSGRIGLGSGSRIELGARSKIDSGTESRAGSGSRSRVDLGSGSRIGSGNGSRIDSVTGSRIGSGSGESRIGSGSSGSKIILGCRTRAGSRSDGIRIGSGYVNRIDSGSGIRIDSGTGSRTESRSDVIRVESGSGFGSVSAWKKSPSPPPRQSSEDSGIEPDSDDLFFLIPQESKQIIFKGFY
ncbi:uncharacterized protein LOC111705838 [Eurytemora carolleeae]|uniref:uncharacterized protein LOC111705838 n=1 Tax=Eurytemora carolleeae TaxID=1294199 RepID=UPI000C78E1E4|nr:uncharacterized protein LOC111705838 [Eurytemora carolleeae]|eukprot:XP_023334288.1 uncharacterized protein LOC111705838 [Eurytemora affinis]